MPCPSGIWSQALSHDLASAGRGAFLPIPFDRNVSSAGPEDPRALLTESGPIVVFNMNCGPDAVRSMFLYSLHDASVVRLAAPALDPAAAGRVQRTHDVVGAGR